jgi:hypothetical protein
MNALTKQFLNLILEEAPKDEKATPPKKEPKKQSAEKPKKKESTSEKPDESKFKKITGKTSNKLSQGRPITDAGLSNMRDRASDPKEANELLKELGLGGIPGSNIYESLYNLYKKAAGTELDVLIKDVSLVQDTNKMLGVQISMADLWSQDDKGGKRSYGYIRSLLIACINAGNISIPSKERKKLRIELLEGTSSLVAYVGKSNSWGMEK